MFYEILLVAYLIVALILIGFILIQQGKGADMGASFGAGGSNTVFGAGGSGNFMTRTTAFLATGFFVISLLLGSLSGNQEKVVDEFLEIQVPAGNEQSVPSSPADSDVPAVGNSSPSEDQTPN